MEKNEVLLYYTWPLNNNFFPTWGINTIYPEKEADRILNAGFGIQFSELMKAIQKEHQESLPDADVMPDFETCWEESKKDSRREFKEWHIEKYCLDNQHNWQEYQEGRACKKCSYFEPDYIYYDNEY